MGYKICCRARITARWIDFSVCRGVQRSKYKTIVDSSTESGSHTPQYDCVCCERKGTAAGVDRGSIGDGSWKSNGLQADARGRF